MAEVNRQTTKEHANMFQLLFYESYDALFVIERGGNITMANKEAERIYGYSEKEFQNKNVLELTINEDQHELQERLVKLADYHRLTMETGHFKKNGGQIPVELAMTLTNFSDRNYAFLMCRDISERIKADEQIQLFTKALSYAPVSVVITNTEGIIHYVNPKFESISGYAAYEAIGQNASIQKSGLHNEGFYNELWGTIKAGKIWHGLFQNKKKNGDFYWEKAYIAPIKNARGAIHHYIAIKEDISAQRRVEQTLRKSEHLYRELITNQGEGVTITDKDDMIVFANPAAERIFGPERGELVGRSLAEFTDEEAFQLIRKQTALRKGGEQTTYEIPITRGDGQRRWLVVTATPRWDNKGKYSGTYGVFRDITDNKQILAELEEAKRKAEESDRLKSAFLANMSHEVRTPLNGIIGFSNLLTHVVKNNAKAEKYARLIQISGNQLLNVVNDILDISMIESQQVRFSYSHFGLNQLLDEMYELYTPQLEEQGKASVELQLKKALPDKQDVVYTDEFRLRQLFKNLLDNAIKFTNEGYIRMGYYLAGNNTIAFYVADSGIGIAKEKQEVIFEPFCQIDNSLSREYGGTGLGLAIADGLVKQMKGHFELTSETGKGSCFTFFLPLQPDKQPNK